MEVVKINERKGGGIMNNREIEKLMESVENIGIGAMIGFCLFLQLFFIIPVVIY